MNGVYACKAIYPHSGEIENGWLFENHFGKGKHAIRFDRDGPNAAYHASWKIVFEWGRDLEDTSPMEDPTHD